MFGPSSALADTVKFGSNGSDYANDGECDDRRFFGRGMADDLDRDDIGLDANDCKKLYRAKKIQLWNRAAAKAASKNAKINFGNNSSEWANDGQCDDIRFEGPGTDSMISVDDRRKDANDSSIQCVHSSITPEQVSDLVDRFYAAVQTDKHLGPIFSNHIGDDWEPHLFEIWLCTFSKTAIQIMHPQAADITIELAKRIATSLWLSRFPDPSVSPPNWDVTTPTNPET
ncbi:hypothetical protein GQR58_027067 [Nymphon striatum]|nr:hypothetical protein GQR58_027067 [Nymphon striatum]